MDNKTLDAIETYSARKNERTSTELNPVCSGGKVIALTKTNQILEEIKASQKSMQAAIGILAKKIERVMKEKSGSVNTEPRKKVEADCQLADDLLVIANTQRFIRDDLYEIVNRIVL